MKSRRTSPIGRVEGNAAFVPVDHLARRVTSSVKEHGDFHIGTNNFFKEKPPIRKFSKAYRCTNFTGVTFGRFTVLGLYALKGRRNSRRWVCRCLCGNYEIRSTKAIRRALKKETLVKRVQCSFCNRHRYFCEGDIPMVLAQ